MRPRTVAAYTIRGKYGTYAVPTIAAVDNRLFLLNRMRTTATPEVAARIRHDLDLLLDWRAQLVEERGSTT